MPEVFAQTVLISPTTLSVVCPVPYHCQTHGTGGCHSRQLFQLYSVVATVNIMNWFTGPCLVHLSTTADMNYAVDISVGCSDQILHPSYLHLGCTSSGGFNGPNLPSLSVECGPYLCSWIDWMNLISIATVVA